MLPKFLLVFFAAFLTVTASAQQPTAAAAEGTFHFTTPQTATSLQEAATIVRTVADIPQLSIDAAQAALLFHGPSDKVALAEWALGQLDQPGGETAVHQYTMPSGEVARVNFLTYVTTPQEMQELLTVLRTVADIQKIFNYTARQAIVLRGKEGDVAFAEWIVDQLNQPAPQKPDTTAREFTVAGNSRTGTAARVNCLANIKTDQGMQEILTVLRTVGGVQRIFPYMSQRKMVFRGTDAEIARAEWLIQGLDQTPGQQNAGSHVYPTPDADDVTRIFYMTNATPQGLQAALTSIRAEAKIRRAFSTTSPATLVVRGTADQVEAAAQTIAARNGLARLR